MIVVSRQTVSLSSTVVLPAEEACDEAHLSTQQPAACQEARLSCTHGDPWWSCRAEEPPRQGPAPSVRLIGRISGRATFERIARDGTRARAGVLWCTFVQDPHISPPQVAYAIGRAFGPAVTRNRLRRRLRALLDTMQPSLPAGMYLIGIVSGAKPPSFNELAFDVRRLVDKVLRTS